MTSLTKYSNGKTSVEALNVIANTAGLIASAVVVFTAFSVLTPSNARASLPGAPVVFIRF